LWFWLSTRTFFFIELSVGFIIRHWWLRLTSGLAVPGIQSAPLANGPRIRLHHSFTVSPKHWADKTRTGGPQLTPAQDDERKRKFRVPRFVPDNQAVSYTSGLVIVQETYKEKLG